MTESQYRSINTLLIYFVAIVATMAMGLISRAMHHGVSLSFVVNDVRWVNMFGFACAFQSLMFIHGLIYYKNITKFATNDGWSAVEHGKRFARFYKSCVVIAFVGMSTFGIAIRVL